MDIYDIELREERSLIKSKNYEIVGFLQNTWYQDGTNLEVIKKYTFNQKFQQELLLKTMVGQRLFTAFSGCYKFIYWDNCTQLCEMDPNSRFDSNSEHILSVVRKIKPSIVLGIGAQSQAVIEKNINILRNFQVKKIMFCRHPSSKGVTTRELVEFGRNVIDEWIKMKKMRNFYI